MTFVIVKWWRGISREFFAGVELRRRKKNIFEKLSEEERGAIRAFAQSTQTFKDFVVWAEKFGAKRHTICLAVVSVIIGSICMNMKAHATVSTETTTCSTHSMQDKYEVASVDNDVGLVATAQVFVEEVFGWLLQPLVRASVVNRKRFHFLLSSGYPQSREPVPIVH